MAAESYSENIQNVVETFVGISRARNREIKDQAGTRSSLTWTSPGIKEITVTVCQEAAGTAELRAAVGICFDAPSDIVADTWLALGDSLSLDSQKVVVPVNTTRTFFFSGAGVSRMDVIRLYGSEELSVFVEAA